uniref:INCENP_ARK-bind domain-containing protein n=1 Tax=Strongyloides venezuelensis TaxID=75913 RepID=A0A0K0FDX4_STRVS
MRRKQNSERNDKVETSPSFEDRKDDTNEIIPNVRVKNNNFDVKKKGIKTKFEGSGIKTFLKKTGQSDIKETLKRPLTGLFRKTPKDVDVKNEEVTQSNSSIKDSVVPFNKESFSTDVIEIHGTGMDDSDDLKHDTPQHDRTQSLLSLAVIEPPKLTKNEMNAIYPLEILNNNAYNQYKVDDIDLNYITRFMWLEDECNDESIPWTWDYLFANVSYEMREETIDDEDEVEDMYKNSTFMT